MQVIAEVVEASIEEYEEGMRACFDAAKIWMQVRPWLAPLFLSDPTLILEKDKRKKELSA